MKTLEVEIAILWTVKFESDGTHEVHEFIYLASIIT